MAKKKNYWKIGVLTAAGLAAVGLATWGGVELYQHFTAPEQSTEETEQTPEDETVVTPEDENTTTESAVMANYAAAVAEACA